MDEATVKVVEGALEIVAVFWAPMFAIIPGIKKIFEGIGGKDERDS